MPTPSTASGHALKSQKLLFKSQGNECATIIESIDWSKTTLGSMDTWPITLHITLSTLLNARLPMALFWGKDHIFFYNDAARFKSNGRHPFAMGKKGAEVWEEQWLHFKPMLERVLEGGDATWTEDEPMPIKLSDGTFETVYSTYSYSPVYDQNGKRVAVLISGIDTTQKVTNYQKLEVSDRNFRNLVNQAPIGIAILYGNDFRFQLANEYYRDIIGKQDVINQPIETVVGNLKEGNILDILKDVRERGIPFRGKQSHEQIIHDGSQIKRYTNFTYEPLREADGKIDRILILVTDVTEQVMSIHKAQEAEKQLRQMANAMPHLVWIANPDGTTTYISDRIAEFSGATRRADGSWRWEGMVHPDDLQATGREWQRALSNGDRYEQEHRLQVLDGTFKWHISRAFPFKNNEGKITKWFGTATDIDEQKKLSEELEIRVVERTKELQSSNNELAQFAYVASHDLQEPLRKIITFIELLQRDLPSIDSKPKSYLRKIEQSAVRMSILIKDILNFSQLGKPGHRFENTDLNASVATITSDLEMVIQQKNAVINIDDLGNIEAIPQQMNQLFYNLLSNALKFTRKEVPPVISIKGAEITKTDLLRFPDLSPVLKYYAIEIRDNGIGFNQKFADQIFTIFQRLNNRDAYSGTGIGLALCKKIAINHNGSIYARSIENIGSVFTIILPVKQPKSEQEAQS
jgi:PAS domain S-box-containing protein